MKRALTLAIAMMMGTGTGVGCDREAGESPPRQRRPAAQAEQDSVITSPRKSSARRAVAKPVSGPGPTGQQQAPSREPS